MSAGELDRDARDEIASVLVRYATGIDRRDWTLLRSCFTGDCDADYGDIGHWHGPDEVAEFMERSHEGCGHTLHRITNIAIEPAGDDRALARSYVDAVITRPDGGGAHAIGFYDDELEQTAEGWKIARRRNTLVHVDALGGGMPR